MPSSASQTAFTEYALHSCSVSIFFFFSLFNSMFCIVKYCSLDVIKRDSKWYKRNTKLMEEKYLIDFSVSYFPQSSFTSTCGPG